MACDEAPNCPCSSGSCNSPPEHPRSVQSAVVDTTRYCRVTRISFVLPTVREITQQEACPDSGTWIRAAIDVVQGMKGPWAVFNRAFALERSRTFAGDAGARSS